MRKKQLRRLNLNRETLQPLTELPQVAGVGSAIGQCCSNPITLTRPTLGFCGVPAAHWHENLDK